MMEWAALHDGPVAIRYPRGNVFEGLEEYRQPIVCGRSEIICKESDIAILSVGHMMEVAEAVWKTLKEKGYNCSLINSRFVKPMDTDVLHELAQEHKLFVTIEDAAISGGYGAGVVKYLAEQKLDVQVLVNGIPDAYIEHGNIGLLRKTIHLDADSIVNKIEFAMATTRK